MGRDALRRSVMVTIDTVLQREMTDRIVEQVGKSFFGPSVDFGDIRMERIRQNVLFATTALLGREIHPDAVGEYCKEYALAHIQAVVKVGEPVGIIAAQSFNQPVTQAVLKSQHRTGAKEMMGTNSLIALNGMSVKDRNIKVHLLSGGTDEDLESLARKFEEVKLEDVLSSTYGNSRYSPVVTNTDWPENFETDKPLPNGFSDHSQNPLFVYINHMFMKGNEVVYRFRIDPSKLKDAGLNQMSVYNVLFRVKDVMVIIHPLSTFTFDIVPGSKPLTAFLEIIKKLMVERLKGVPGLHSIGERKINVTRKPGDMSGSSIIAQHYYEKSTDKTFLFLDVIGMMHFPVDELKKRIIHPDRDEVASVESEVTRLHHGSNCLFHIVYSGKVRIEQTPYKYYIFTGSLTMKKLLDYETDAGVLFSKLCDHRYLIDNDPAEMIEFIGRTGARIIHEHNYSEELTNGKTPLLYQHMTTICRRMFGIVSNPIRPSSYLRSKDIGALAKLGNQEYKKNLQQEMIKGNHSPTNHLPTAIMAGRRATLGTGAIEVVVDNVRRQEVIQLYSKARRDQRYFGMYPNVSFPKLGEIEPMTTIPLKPFGETFRLPGRATGE